jgi:hypothetical protein
LYVAWGDVRRGRSEIYLAYSQDSGKSWSMPVPVDDAPLGANSWPDNFMPTLSVNKEGVVGLVWYDRRDHNDNLGWTPRFAASVDGGETFEPSLRISEAGMSQKNARFVDLFTSSYGGANRSDGHKGPVEADISISRAEWIGGDYCGLASDAKGVFHPLWIENRTGVRQVWTTTISVKGHGIVNGSTDLATWADVSERATLDLQRARYNPKTHTVTADVYLVNSSAAPLHGPLKTRVLSIQSAMGDPTIADADAGGHSTGAILDFSGLLNGRELAAGARSNARRVTFKLANPTSLGPHRRTETTTEFIHFRAKILQGR